MESIKMENIITQLPKLSTDELVDVLSGVAACCAGKLEYLIEKNGSTAVPSEIREMVGYTHISIQPDKHGEYVLHLTNNRTKRKDEWDSVNVEILLTLCQHLGA